MSDDRERIEKLAMDLYAQARGNPQRLATLAAQFKLAAADNAGGPLEVVGIVSSETGAPWVHLRWGNERGQVNPEQARAHALLVLEAAQNAVNDAAILQWARDELELDLERAAVMLDVLRRYRSDHWGQPDLEIEFERPAPEEP